MAKVIINKNKCKGCFLCISFCPQGLLKKSSGLNKQGVNSVELPAQDKCLGCALCAIICPDCCIEVYK